MKEVKVIAPVKDEGSLNDGSKEMPKRRVAAYARVSTGSEEQATSFENQVSYWEKWISEQKDCELVKVYADHGKSGTSTKKRVSFNEMIRDALDGKIDLIVCKSISRFARNTLDSIATVRQLKAVGVEVYFDNEHLWSLKAGSEFTLTVLSSMAQEESRHISENITWAFRKKMQDGKPFVCTTRFLGYDKNEAGDQLVVNKDEAVIVKLIFDLYDSGIGCLRICNELMRRGYRTVTGNVFWHTSVIMDILRNEKYCGDLMLQKTYTFDYLTHTRRDNDNVLPKYYVKDAHEAIVPRDQWKRVQARIKDSYESIVGPNFDKSKHNNKYPLSGAMICQNCGHTYKRRIWNSKHDTAKKYVYQCTHYVIKDEKGETCHSKPIGETTAHEICCDVINNVYLKNSRIFSKMTNLIQSTFKLDKIESEKRKLSRIKEDLSEKIDVLMVERLDAKNLELKEKIDKKYQQLLDQYEHIDNELAYLTQREIVANNSKSRMDKMLAVLNKNKVTPDMLTREMVDVFFYKIFVSTSSELTFVIDTSHTLTLEKLIEKREEIANYESIYSSEKADRESRFKNIVKYKVVLV